MRVSVFEQGYTNLISDETIEDWDGLVDRLIDVQVGTKNGSYIVRGHCDGPRSDSNMKALDLIVIDGDQTLEAGNTCTPIEPIHEVLKSQNVKHCIHSSYSQNLVNSVFKWRMVIPCNDLVDAGALSQGVSEVISLLHENQLMVSNVVEDNTPSQPWFLPRCPEGFEDDFTCLYHDGEPWKLGSVKVLPSANIRLVGDNGNGKTGSGFSWEWAIGQISSGTIHQAAKSICGWLISTTDWAPSQIKTYLATLISSLCPDPVKVKRAVETKEIDNLIAYCQEHHGVFENAGDWKEDIMSAADLRDKVFPPTRWAVNGILPEGLTILAGDPKAGKSLMAVDICSAIASGSKAFGNRKCIEGMCVYYSLEDMYPMVQARIKKQSNIWSEKFKIITKIRCQLGDSFYKLLDEMVMMWPDLRCVVIDTMAKIIPGKPPGITDYEHYYKYLDPLHQWAGLNHVAMVLITHLNKSRAIEGENPFNSIIGSVAIQGTSDAMLLLKKNHAKADIINPDLPDGFLEVQGRELGTDKYTLEFNDEEMKWCIVREAVIEDVTGNSNWLLIADSLKRKQKSPAEIAKEIKKNGSTVRSCLKRMVAERLIKNENSKYGLIGVDYADVSDVW